MGLKYNSGESSSLISVMENNFRVSENAVEGLTEGGNRVVSALSGNSLSGEAYNMANGLFSELLLPTFRKSSEAIEDMKSDLQLYREANGLVSEHGVLDETNLTLQITIKKSSKYGIDKTLEYYQFLMISSPVAALVESLFDSKSQLQKISESLALQIQELEEKLRVLYQFSESTSSLFVDSLDAMKIIVQAANGLKNLALNSDGTLPKGYDRTWLESLDKLSFASELERISGSEVGGSVGEPGKQNIDVPEGLNDPNSPNYDPLLAWEIQQGGIGDCWLIAQFKAMLSSDSGRQTLRDGIKWNESKSAYDVRIYVDGKEKWVTVDKVYDNAATRNGSPSIVSLYEAAIGQEKGKKYQFLWWEFGDSYLNGGKSVNAISLTENSEGEVLRPSDLASAAIESNGSIDGTSAIAASRQEYADGKEELHITASSYPDGPQVSINIVASHAYEIVEVKDGMIGLRNPWRFGNDKDGKAQNAEGVFYISQEDFNRAFDNVQVEK